MGTLQTSNGNHKGQKRKMKEKTTKDKSIRNKGLALGATILATNAIMCTTAMADTGKTTQPLTQPKATVSKMETPVPKPIQQRDESGIVGRHPLVPEGTKFNLSAFNIKAYNVIGADISDRVQFKLNEKDDYNKVGTHTVTVYAEASKGYIIKKDFRYTVIDKSKLGNNPNEPTIDLVNGKVKCHIEDRMSRQDVKDFILEALPLAIYDKVDGNLLDKATYEFKDTTGKYDSDVTKTGKHVLEISVTNSRGKTTKKTIEYELDHTTVNNMSSLSIGEEKVKTIKTERTDISNKPNVEVKKEDIKKDVPEAPKEIKKDEKKEAPKELKKEEKKEVQKEEKKEVKKEEKKEVKKEIRKDNNFPVITGTDLNLKVGDTFNIKNVHIQAFDKEDGDLTSKVQILGADKVNTSKEGTYEIKTVVDDKDGAETVHFFKINVEKPKTTIKESPDKPKEKHSDSEHKVIYAEDYPTLTLQNVYIDQGEKLTKDMFKAKAYDRRDGNITDDIIYDDFNLVDTEHIGDYYVKAHVTNSKGLKSEAKVRVRVERRKNAVLGVNVIDADTGKYLLSNGLYGIKIGSNITDSVLPIDIMKNRDIVKTVVNGVEGTKVQGIALPTKNLVTVYVRDHDFNPKESPKVTANPSNNTPVKTPEKTVNDKVKEIIKNTPPTVTGNDTSLKVGDRFVLSMLNLKAIDIEDGDITDNIEMIASNVDTSKAGNYQVTVTVKDKDGEEINKTFKVTVIERDGANGLANVKANTTPTDNKKTDTKNESTDKTKKNNEDKKETKEKAKSERKHYQTGLDATAGTQAMATGIGLINLGAFALFKRRKRK